MDIEALGLFMTKAKLLKCNYVMALGNIIIGTDEHFAHLSIMEHTEPKFWKLQNTVFDTKQFTVAEGIDFVYLLDTINNILQTPPTLEVQSLHENETFKNIMAKKADEGMSMFKLGEYLISLNKTLIPLNKSDKLDVNIRDFGNTFCGEYIIRKGKNVVIKKYFLYLKV